MTARAAQKLATRAKILAAAKIRFEVTGYEAATIRGIAEAAGMSTGAVFGNWLGKAELYRDVYGHDPIAPENGRALLLAARAVSASRGGQDALTWLNGVLAVIDDRDEPKAEAA